MKQLHPVTCNLRICLPPLMRKNNAAQDLYGWHSGKRVRDIAVRSQRVSQAVRR